MPNVVLDVIKSRRSVRAYKEEQIKDEELEMILEGGLWAPSGTNDQSWHFTVIQNKELLDDISEKCKSVLKKSENEDISKLGGNEKLHIFYNAPTVILVSANQQAVTPMEDSSGAVENMLLVAESLSIGSCWVGIASPLFDDSELGPTYREKCGIPENYKVMHAIPVGYKTMEHQNAPARKEHKINYIK